MKARHNQIIRRLEYQWRQASMRRWVSDRCGVRHGLAAAQFIDNSRLDAPYVEIHSLMILAVYAESAAESDSPNGTGALRVGGYRVSRIPHGIQWGGVANSELFKDLKLMPGCGAKHLRFDCRNTELLRRALALSNLLIFANRQSRIVRRRLSLPTLWAAFRTRVAQSLVGEGPEFEQACRRSSATPQEVLYRARRRFDGLCLYPLDWFDAELELATTVFAEMAGFAATQIFRCITPSQDLTGYNGASQFDFYRSRFRRLRTKVVADMPETV